MRTLPQLTQSRLAAFLIDEKDGKPLKRVPVYAELSIYGNDARPIDIDRFRDEIPEFELISPLVEEALAAAFGDAFAGLSHAQQRRLVRKLAAVPLEHEGFFQLPRSRQREVMAEIADELRRGLDPVPEPLPATLRGRLPLGYLATDHVGFLSFDLEPAARQLRAMTGRLQIGVHLYPLGREAQRIDVLEQGRIGPDVILGKLELPMKPLGEDVALQGLKLPSLQNPGLLDWYLSGASFTAQPAALIGQDGCEHLFPGNFALQEFVLRQIVRLTDRPALPSIPTAARLGFVDEYRVAFAPLGHSLGQILYTLPLAPGETVKLAVIDWSFRSDTERTEATRLYENLLHDTHRDRTITETVKAGLDEFQTGSSFMGGAALAAGASGSYGSFGGAAGLTGSLGGSTASSSGSRDLAAQNVQRLSDAFSQASSARRELQSTVVIQARQEQSESIQTRTFTNYNHSHTLTILYYEVLRHYRLVTEWARRRPVVLLPLKDFVPAFDKDDETIHADLIEHRQAIERQLLEPRWKAGFDALERLQALRKDYERLGAEVPTVIRPAHPPFRESTIGFTLFEFVIKTRDGDLTPDKVVLWAVLRDGGAVPLHFLYYGPHRDEEHNGFDNGGQNINSGGRFDVDSGNQHFFVRVDNRDTHPVKTIEWGRLAGFQFEKWGEEDWRIDWLGIRGFDNHGAIVDLLPMTDIDHHVVGEEPCSQSVTFIKRPGPDAPDSPPIDVPPLHKLTPDEYVQLTRLRSHVVKNAAHYRRAIALAREPQLYAATFETRDWNATEKCIDHVLPTPLDVFGESVVFGLVGEEQLQPDLLQQLRDDIRSNDPVRHQRALAALAALSDADLERTLTRMALAGARAERLISLPTRGVFGEGKLGHCNLSETIDETRYWKWEEHPIPFEAPAIGPVVPISPTPQAIAVQPTPFPTSLVNIVNPTAAPDPGGLAAALSLLGTPNIFRDMSGRQEVADLLKKLSDNSISIADAATKARDIQNKYGTELDKQQKELEIAQLRARPAGTEAETQRAASAAATQAEASARKASVDAATAQTEAAKHLPEPYRDAVYKDAAQTLAGNPTANKVVVLRAYDFTGAAMTGKFGFKLRDLQAATDVVTEADAAPGFSRAVTFASPEPVVEAQATLVPPASITLHGAALNFAALEIKANVATYVVGKSHRLVTVALKQASRTASFGATSTADATTKLMADWGTAAGATNAQAQAMVEAHQKEHGINHGAGDEKRYTISVPLPKADLTVTSG